MAREKKEKKKKKGRTGFIIIIVVLVLVILGVFGRMAMKSGMIPGPPGMSGDGTEKGRPSGRPGAPGTPEEEEEPVFSVNTTPAVLGPIADYFLINGEVITESSVDIYADTQGILARMEVGIGDYVRKDTVIAQVDPSRPGLNFALSPVKTRVAGTVTKLPLDVGDAVNPQTPIATVGDLSSLQVVTSIPERFISKIRVGMPAEISLKAWPGHLISVRVTEINPVVDASSRTQEIKMDIPRGDDKAQAGMYAEIKLTTETKDDVVKIPADCILRRMGDIFVFVARDDGTAEKRIVVPGITLDGVVEIVDGLRAGEMVVYQGQTLLENDVDIRVVREIAVIDGER